MRQVSVKIKVTEAQKICSGDVFNREGVKCQKRAKEL